MPPVTLKEIADSLNVSPMTVSRALRHTGRISERLRQSIIEKAQSLGYQANPVARALQQSSLPKRSGGGLNLGFIHTGRLNRKSLRIRQTVAASRGHSLSVFNTNEWPSLAALKKTLVARGIDGVFIDSHVQATDPVAVELTKQPHWHTVSLIKLGNGFPLLNINRVRSSVFTQVTTCHENVIALGYRRIAFIFHHSASQMDDKMRFGAALAAKAEAKKSEISVATWIIAGHGHSWNRLQEAAISEQLNTFLSDFKPDAIIGFGPVIYTWLIHNGYKIPEDFAYASTVVQPEQDGLVAGTIDDLPNAEFASAMILMEKQLAHGERGFPSLVQDHLLPVQWKNGTTLPPNSRPARKPKRAPTQPHMTTNHT